MKRTSVVLACGAILIVSALTTSCGENYGKQLSADWKRIFNLNGAYEWSGYPVDNFGVGTAYQPPNGKDWNDGNRVCATWSCLGITAPPTDSEQRLKVVGFADIGTGGNVELSESQTRDISASVLLPALAHLLKLNASVDWTKGVTTTLTLGQGTSRSLDRPKFNAYMRGLGSSSGLNDLKAAFDRGDLVIVAADFVVSSIHAEVRVNSKLNPQADVALAAGAKAASAAVGSGANATFNFDSETTGDYVLDVKQPVVLAVLAVKQPGPGVLAVSANPANQWADWKPVTARQTPPGSGEAPKGLLPLPCLLGGACG